MSTTHGPGPWAISPIHTNEIKGTPGDGLIATVCENRHGEWEANANLIAAAPELLEALETYIKRKKAGWLINLAWANDTDDMIEAAIAKAKGGAAK